MKIWGDGLLGSDSAFACDLIRVTKKGTRKMGHNRSVKSSDSMLSRREFIKRSAVAAGYATLGGSELLKSGFVAMEDEKTRVVVVTCPEVMAPDKPVDLAALRRMVERGVTELAGKQEVLEAWKTFITPSDAVVLNDAGNWLANVPEVVLEVMNGIIGASPKSAKLAYFSRQSRGWIKSIKAGLAERGIPEDVMDSDLCQRIPLEPFTVLVMTPTLKSHTIAGVSGVVKHFATLCKEGPAPHHPDAMRTAGSVIVPQFGHLRKLIIVDALRFGETTKGPSYYQGSLIFGTDPVAVDSVSLEIFLKNCKPHGTLDPWFHIRAADKEYHAGTADKSKIEIHDIKM